MIRIENLVKTFDNTTVLNGLNLHVKKGSIYGLVGVNGSGKTTVIKHLTGVYRPNSGNVTIGGTPVYDDVSVKSRVTCIADDLYFFSNYNIKSLSGFYRGMYKSWNDDMYAELSALFKLDDRKPIRKFSKGMQKQAAFIFAMSAMPDALLLDEPIDGLDPIIRKHVLHHILAEAANREMTVLLSSHNLKEIEGVCDSIGIIKNGRMFIERDIDDLKASAVKVQLAFPPEVQAGKEKYKNLNLDIVHYERRENSSVELLIVRGGEDAVKRVRSLNPLICDTLPLTLDEIFIYEMEGGLDEIPY